MLSLALVYQLVARKSVGVEMKKCIGNVSDMKVVNVDCDPYESRFHTELRWYEGVPVYLYLSFFDVGLAVVGFDVYMIVVCILRHGVAAVVAHGVQLAAQGLAFHMLRREDCHGFLAGFKLPCGGAVAPQSGFPGIIIGLFPFQCNASRLCEEARQLDFVVHGGTFGVLKKVEGFEQDAACVAFFAGL